MIPKADAYKREFNVVDKGGTRRPDIAWDEDLVSPKERIAAALKEIKTVDIGYAALEHLHRWADLDNIPIATLNGEIAKDPGIVDFNDTGNPADLTGIVPTMNLIRNLKTNIDSRVTIGRKVNTVVIPSGEELTLTAEMLGMYSQVAWQELVQNAMAKIRSAKDSANVKIKYPVGTVLFGANVKSPGVLNTDNPGDIALGIRVGCLGFYEENITNGIKVISGYKCFPTPQPVEEITLPSTPPDVGTNPAEYVDYGSWMALTVAGSDNTRQDVIDYSLETDGQWRGARAEIRHYKLPGFYIRIL